MSNPAVLKLPGDSSVNETSTEVAEAKGPQAESTAGEDISPQHPDPNDHIQSTANAYARIEVDRELTDNDSAYGDDMQVIPASPSATSPLLTLASTFTASLTSSVYSYPYENGRRYHAYQEGKYIMPNDEQENNRLDMAHHMMVLRTYEKLHLAPIGSNPGNILDIGTGTGIWPIQMGDLYPSAQILGNDLSPVQPSMVPPNVKFEVDDVESEWTYGMVFDYIHCRYMATALANWPALVQKCYDHVKPGGWVEFQDYDMQYYSDDGSMKLDCPLAKWIGLSIKAAYDNRRDPSPGPKLEGWVRDAGFVDVHHERLKLPIGPWPKERNLKTLGAWNLVQILEGLEGFSLALFTRTLGWPLEEVQVLLAHVRKDLRNPNIHSQLDFHVVYARKPEI